MLLRYKIGWIIIAILVLFSCEHKPGPCLSGDIPGEYFPAFPMSWWKYSTNNVNDFTLEISDTYLSRFDGCRPVLLNKDFTISGNQILHDVYIGQGVVAAWSSPIYSLSYDTLLCSVSFATFQKVHAALGISDIHWRRKTITSDTILTLDNSTTFNSVIIVEEWHTLDSNYFYLDYFSKNVGLIRRDSMDANNHQNFITILQLDEYYIGQE